MSNSFLFCLIIIYFILYSISDFISSFNYQDSTNLGQYLGMDKIKIKKSSLQQCIYILSAFIITPSLIFILYNKFINNNNYILNIINNNTNNYSFLLAILSSIILLIIKTLQLSKLIRYRFYEVYIGYISIIYCCLLSLVLLKTNTDIDLTFLILLIIGIIIFPNILINITNPGYCNNSKKNE